MGDGNADAPGGKPRWSPRAAVGTPKPQPLPCQAACPSARPPALASPQSAAGNAARRGGGESPARARGSPAGEEVKQRVLLLLSARRHDRAGSAARRSRSRDARGLGLRWPRCPPSGGRRRSHARRAGGPGARSLRGVAAGQSAASAALPSRQPEPRAPPSRGGGWAVTSRGGARRGCGPGPRVPIGRQVDVGVATQQTWGGVSPGRLAAVGSLG